MQTLRRTARRPAATAALAVVAHSAPRVGAMVGLRGCVLLPCEQLGVVILRTCLCNVLIPVANTTALPGNGSH